MIQLRNIVADLGWTTSNLHPVISKLANGGVSVTKHRFSGKTVESYVVPTESEDRVREILGQKPAGTVKQPSSKISNKVPQILLSAGETGSDLVRRFQAFVGKKTSLESEIQKLEQRCVKKDEIITKLSEQTEAMRRDRELAIKELNDERMATRQLKELFDNLGVE